MPTLTAATAAAPIAVAATVAAVATAWNALDPYPMMASKPLSNLVRSLSTAATVLLSVLLAATRLVENDLSMTPAILIASLYSFPVTDNLSHLLNGIQQIRDGHGQQGVHARVKRHR